MKSIRLFSFILVAVFAFVAKSFANSLVPPTPTEFGYIVQATNNEKWNVTLKWMEPGVDNEQRKATGFRIYRSTVKSENMADYTLIATVTTPLQYPTFSYTDANLDRGTYYYFIVAYNSNGDAQRTAIKTVVVPQENNGGDKFRFVTTPPSTVQPGGTYRYEAKAQHPQTSAVVRYAIVQAPDGATIDPVTGVITWTAPSQTGSYTFKIKAYLENGDEIIYQSWTVKVKGEGSGGDNKEGCVVVRGTVKDEQGNAVRSGMVAAYILKANDNGSTIYKGLFKAAFQNGEFVLRINEGDYIFRTEGESYYGEWFENASEGAQARKFTVKCGDTVNLNFVVTLLPPETKYTFCGQVKDAGTNQSTFGVVYFYRKAKNGSGDNIGEAIMVKTNDNGEYCIELSDRYNYIAMAKKPENEDYLAQYFDGVSTPTQATLLVPTANRNDINFSLSMRQQYSNGFSGRLIDSAGNGVVGRAVAYLIKAANGKESQLERYRTVETDANGNYNLQSLVPGDYVVFGIPNARTLVPGYCKLGDFAVINWREATTITLTETSVLTTEYNIKLRAGNGKKGVIRIGGGTKDGGIIKGSNNSQGATTVPGVFVVVKDDKNNIVDYTFSAADGSYSIPEVGLGTVTIIADHPAYMASQKSLTLTAAQLNVTQNIALVRNATTDVTEEAVHNATLYPNPAANSLRVSFTGEQATARVSIVNTLGVELSATTVNVSNGVNSIDLNTAELASGNYMVRISIANALSSIPFVVVR